MDAGALWAELIDDPTVAVGVFMVGWLMGLVAGYVLVRLVLR